MKKTVMFVLAAAVAVWLAYPTMGVAKPEFAAKEKVKCDTCHVKPMKGDENLKDVGKCYKEKKDLKACEKK